MPMSQPVPVFLRVTHRHCEIKLTLVNGTSGAVHLDAHDLTHHARVKAQFDKALRMADMRLTARNRCGR